MARGVALALSLGLALFVVVNAQFGCDSPASNAPPPEDTAPPNPPPAEPEPKAEPAVKPNSEPAVEADAEPPPTAPSPPANDVANSPPVLMPASKSGGDWGPGLLPGEQSPTQQAPEPAPQK